MPVLTVFSVHAVQHFGEIAEISVEGKQGGNAY
jgi:hypothetical protein